MRFHWADLTTLSSVLYSTITSMLHTTNPYSWVFVCVSSKMFFIHFFFFFLIKKKKWKLYSPGMGLFALTCCSFCNCTSMCERFCLRNCGWYGKEKYWIAQRKMNKKKQREKNWALCYIVEREYITIKCLSHTEFSCDDFCHPCKNYKHVKCLLWSLHFIRCCQ